MTPKLLALSMPHHDRAMGSYEERVAIQDGLLMLTAVVRSDDQAVGRIEGRETGLVSFLNAHQKIVQIAEQTKIGTPYRLPHSVQPPSRSKYIGVF